MIGTYPVFSAESIPPEQSIKQVGSGNTDINNDMGLDYVFLAPTYTNNPDEGCTSFEFILQYEPLDGSQELAPGSSGPGRYLGCKRHSPGKSKIRRVALYRKSGSAITLDDVKRNNYEGMTADINKDRGGDFLSLVWSSYKDPEDVKWRCGPKGQNRSCKNGQCCSISGWCSNSPEHCGYGCQFKFGFCDATVSRPVPCLACRQRG
ncbi:hypothetical protein CDD83_1572 [Cordyceps sp. RAO-2017]|nr:hypothetical protein CDD83_1572 [Cordyceps sp. RAO-2017]